MLFAPRYVTSGASRVLEISRLAIARHILRPLVNYAIIRPLLTSRGLMKTEAVDCVKTKRCK